MSTVAEHSVREAGGDGAGAAEVILRGGPDDFPAGERIHRLLNDADKVKVPYCGGYEHFERTGGTDDAGRPVFEWTGRTRVAE